MGSCIRLKFQNIPANTDFNFDRQETIICSCDRLFLSNHSPTITVFSLESTQSQEPMTMSHRLLVWRNNTCFAKSEVIFLFAPPPTTGKGPLQTISHPRNGRAGLSPGMVTGQIEPCIIEELTFQVFRLFRRAKVSVK